MMNVFAWDCTKRYYLLHPWRWFRELGQNLRAAHHRAKYGWCGRDVWNMDDWFLHVIPDMLEHLRKHGCGYPGHEPFETVDKWNDWLYKQECRLRYCAEDNDTENEGYSSFRNYLDLKMQHLKEENDDGSVTVTYTPENEETWKQIRDYYFERDKEIRDYKKEILKRTFTDLAEHFDCLWD